MDRRIEDKIAVVGLGALFPDASNIEEYWQNIISKKVSIRRLPPEMFEEEVYFRPELLTARNKQDKSYTNIAAYIENLRFDTVRRYKIPPSVAEHMDTNQHAALYSTDQALSGDLLRDVANDRVGVVFGNGMVGINYGHALARVQFQLIEHHFRRNPQVLERFSEREQEELLQYLRDTTLSDTIPITEDSAPGILPNIIAGRIANVFDFHGPSFTVDAACASALTAIITGMQGLLLNEYDAVVCGGADMPLKQLGFIYFSAISALSPTGSFPFDKRANGFVMGQGSGTVVLKRLGDALRHNDTIYGIITGYGEASDGKGKYIAAPNEDWQAVAVEKACRMAGYSVDTIELIEAHGTATTVGDVVEVAALKKAFARLGGTRANYCGLTSVKSNIGHLKSAAGIAGFIKAVLALHHKTLPPTASFAEINPRLEIEGSPFYIIDEAREWQASASHPRRANVSAFGFGGADYHIALQEYREEDFRGVRSAGVDMAALPAATAVPAPGAAQAAPGLALAATGAASAARGVESGAAFSGAAAGQSGRAAAAEESVIFFAAAARPELAEQVNHFFARGDQGISLAQAGALHNYAVSPGQHCRLAIAASSFAELQSKFQFFAEKGERLDPELLRARGIFYKEGAVVAAAATAVMFPGQASQYPDMLQNIYRRHDTMRRWFHKADAHWLTSRGTTVSALIWPPDGASETAAENLRQTHNAHPAIFVSSYALYRLLSEWGLEAGTFIGHSLGEITALAAAGKIDFAEALQLVGQRGYAFHDEPLPDPGKMISVMGPREMAEQLIRESGRAVAVANLNSPQQTILSGSSAEIDAFKLFVDGKEINNKILFVSHAFHSALIEPVAERFYEHIREVTFRKSAGEVMMNHTGTYYPNTAKGLATIPALLREQILAPVDFVRSIQHLYDQGVRLFVEVGPGSILSTLVKEILKEKAVTVLTANYRNADDYGALQKLVGALFVEGFPMELPAGETASVFVKTAEAAGAQPAASAQSSSATPAQAPAAAQPAPAAGGPGTAAPAAAHPAAAPQPAQGQPARPAGRTTVVYSGAAIGLPGSYKQLFQDDNFAQIFAGHNFIERLTDAEKQQLVDLRVTKVVKDEKGPSFKLLESLEDVIQLAGKVGRLDMIRDYHIDEKDAANLTSCIAMGIAAGYEALRDAHIPLVREYLRTASGSYLPQKLALPKYMQQDTGVIFANGFPMIDPVIEEVSRHVSHRFGHKTRKELMSFYESIIARVKDHETRKLLTDWYTLFYSRLTDQPGEAELYQFNYNFMNRISAQANNRLATLINARGPNLQMNAACSSTANAISIAEDFIRTGRVKRMLVIGADDPSSRTNLALLGAGFLATGAATSEGDLYKAAIPFDRRRNGMIMSSGAVGIVLESREEAERRGIIPVAELIGTRSFNTAKHPSQIDIENFSVELEQFIAAVEGDYGLDRRALAAQLLYISHETYTPPRGGCSQTEAEALRRSFGDDFRRIIVGNTKGMTGHTMGAAIEDAVAAKALQYSQVPPVVNYAEPDPMLEGLNLSRGGRHECRYALKMSAGFGSQGHFALLKKVADGENRIADRARHEEWLRTVSGDPEAKIELRGRILAIVDRPELKRAAAAAEAPARREPALTVPTALNQIRRDSGMENLPQGPAMIDGQTAAPAPPARAITAREVIAVIARATGYPEEMLELDMELAADLGLDGAKLAALLGALTAEFNVPMAEAALPARATIATLVNLVTQTGRREAAQGSSVPAAGASGTMQSATPALSGAAGAAAPASGGDAAWTSAAPASAAVAAPARDSRPAAGGTGAVDRESVQMETIKVFAEITKYPEDMLDLGMEMEADLGIDTVKQATILSILGEKYHLQQQQGMQLSSYPTIGHIVDLIVEQGSETGGEFIEPIEVVDLPPAAAQAAAPQAAALQVAAQEMAAPQTAAPEAAVAEASRSEMAPSSSGAPQVAAPEPAGTAPKGALARQVAVLVKEAAPAADWTIGGKSVWLLADEAGMAAEIEARLSGQGAAVATFLFPSQPGDAPLEAAAATFAAGAAPELIIDASHIGPAIRYAGLEQVEAEALLWRSSTARFIFYKHLAGKGIRPSRILLLTAMDGRFGLEPAQPAVTDPTFGALTGLYKSLRKEWPETLVRLVDLAPAAVGADLARCLDEAVAEMSHGGTGVEVCYPEHQRHVVKILDREIGDVETLSFTEGDTFLVTGGGSGIGAAILLGLAERYPARFIVIGNVELPEKIAELADLDDAGLGGHRSEIHARLQAEHAKVTPVMVNTAFAAVTRAIEVYRNIERVRQLGRRIDYIACDVRDLDSLRRQLAALRQDGEPVTALIHAAGLDKSHTLLQKSAAEFTQVFSVKAAGADNLTLLLREEPLRFAAAFCSISGRFGNAAQADYSAANSYLSYWIRMLRGEHPGLHGVSLAWSGWKDTGMAWRNEFVRQKSEELGLNWIPVADGVEAFLREASRRSDDLEVIIHKGLGGFIEAGLSVRGLDKFPLIDRVDTSLGQITRSWRILSVKRDGLIDQHRLGKVPILPAVAYAELAAEFYALQTGKAPSWLLRHITFANAFKLFREEPRELYVEGRPAGDGTAWEIEIKSDFYPPNMAQAQTVVHSTTTVSRQLSSYQDLQPENWSYRNDEPTSLPAEQSLMLIKNSGIEQRIILGPLFNDTLRDAAAKEPVLIYPRGATYPTYFPLAQLDNPRYPLEKWLVNPSFLDSIYQACAAHLLVTKNRVFLPWEVAELGIVDTPRTPGLYRTYAQVTAESDDIVTYEVVMHDEAGRVRYFGRGVQFRKINL